MAGSSLFLFPQHLFLCRHFDSGHFRPTSCPAPAAAPWAANLAQQHQDHHQPYQQPQAHKQHGGIDRRLRLSHLTMEGLVEWDEGAEKALTDPEETRVLYTALDSFRQYARVSHFNVTHLRRQSFYALPEAHWKMLAAPPFNFLDTLVQADEAIDSNADLARQIVKHGLQAFSDDVASEGDNEPSIPAEWVGTAKPGDIDKARSTLRQFFRDWTAEGAEERQICYGPVMRALEKERARCPGRTDLLKVLVPGAGLGRLVFDLALKGHHVEGNEISYHQMAGSNYILNGCESAAKHTIYPWIHTFSNHLSRDNHLRSYKVPDIHPGTALTTSTEKVGTMSMVAADFLCLYGGPQYRDAFDAVASVFFLDTAPNLIRYLSVIFHCLKPGGVLINVGPLLWHFEGHAPGAHSATTHDDEGIAEQHPGDSSGIADPGSFELTDDEVMALVEKLGFVVEERQTGIEAPYIHDKDSMLKTVYRASVWVARKPLEKMDEPLNPT